MQINIIGAGMGGSSMTLEATELVRSSDIIIGAPRLLSSLPPCGAKTTACCLPEKIVEEVNANSQATSISIILSGDVGFYSAAKKLLELLAPYPVCLVCGISTPQALAAALGRPWQDFCMVSAHGKECDVLAQVLNHKEVFLLTDNHTTPSTVCTELCNAGLGDALVYVGENLGSENQQIHKGTAKEIAGRSFSPLCALLIENNMSFSRDICTHGIEDRHFLRGNVPMTKREVRSIALSMLEILRDDVLWDVGAGTGSVSVEMALLARYGKVYAVEKNPDAIKLIKQNRENFGAYNIFQINGKAPEILLDLPAPNAVFIGGSSGKLREILGHAISKNPEVRVVITAVTLETIVEAEKALSAMGFTNIETVQIAATRLEKAGIYHMFRAQNPVFIICGKGVQQ